MIWGKFDYCRTSGRCMSGVRDSWGWTWCSVNSWFFKPNSASLSGPPFHCLPLSPPGFLSTVCFFSWMVIHQLTWSVKILTYTVLPTSVMFSTTESQNFLVRTSLSSHSILFHSPRWTSQCSGLILILWCDNLQYQANSRFSSNQCSDSYVPCLVHVVSEEVLPDSWALWSWVITC